MPRKPRWLQLAADAAHHVMSRGQHRETLFAQPEDFRHVLALRARSRQRFDFCLDP